MILSGFFLIAVIVGFYFLYITLSHQASSAAVPENEASANSEEEVMRYVGEELLHIDLSDWKATSMPSLKARVPGDCVSETGTGPCKPQPDMEYSLSIVTQGKQEYGNERPVQARYLALVQYGQEALSDSYENAELNTYECDLLVRAKRNNIWQKEYLGKMYEESYGGSTRYAKPCGKFEISWDKAGYPVLKAGHFSGPFIGGNYSESEQTIHFTGGTYEYDVEIIKEGTLDEMNEKR